MVVVATLASFVRLVEVGVTFLTASTATNQFLASVKVELFC